MATSPFINSQLAACLANGLGALCGLNASGASASPGFSPGLSPGLSTGYGGFFGGLSSAGSSLHSSSSTSREHSISSIDSVLADMVNALDLDEAEPMPEHQLQCDCGEMGPMAARCTTCTEVLCDSCAHAHQRAPLTRHHLLVRVDDMSVPPPGVLAVQAVLPAPPAQSCTVPLAAPSPASRPGRGRRPAFPCDRHPREEVTVFCGDCAAAICGRCKLDSHRGHEWSSLRAAIEASRAANCGFVQVASRGAQALADRVDVTLKMADEVDAKAAQVAAEVREASRRLVAAVEARERELLAHVERVQALKAKSLLLQAEGMRGLQQRYVRLADSLRDSLQREAAVDALHCQDKAAVELKQLRAARANLAASPFEDAELVFVPPEPLLVRALSSAGAVSSSAYALTTVAVGEGLSCAVRGRPATLTVHVKNHLGEAVAGPGTAELLEAVLVAPDGTATRADVEPRDGHADGSLLVTYRPRSEGRHSLHVTLRGQHIAGSPFRPVVRAIRAYDGPRPPVTTFGGEGSEQGSFLRPWGICCDRQGRLIVADRSNNRIQVFGPDGSFRFAFGVQGKEPGEFDRPAGVCCDAQGRIVVVDKDNHRVQIFSAEGKFILTFGEQGSRDGQLHYPWDVDVNEKGEIVVSDTRNNRIQLFSCTGRFLKKFGWEGSATMLRHFDTPRGVCFNPEGYIVVTDFNNHRLVVVEPSFRHARYLGSEGSGQRQFLRPQGLAIDRDGNMIVADSRNNRVQVLEGSGKFRCFFGSPDVEMDRPSGVCVTPDGRIAVVDFGNNRVVIL